MKLTVLVFEAKDGGIEATYDGSRGSTYTFEGYRLETGEVCIPETQTNDGWFEDADSVDAHGTDIIVSCKATSECVEWSDERIADSITGSANEFGKGSVPSTLHKYIRAE